eukprot:TRINITY_DN6720_c0_g1_i3.p1 TRINITY_DN6720_c0_g1~~TRINITY_DN6720_c0_g1_i3.p1  ORF type:complete len:144 (+),score=27.75 TRINITY_DN6720_c0_g1_i3:61-492(+)
MDPSVLYWPTVEPSSLHNKLRTGGVTKRRSSKAGDDRSNQQLRPIHMSVGPLSRAVGSAFIEIGGTTKVIASVYGPRQQSLQQQQTTSSKRAILNCAFRFSTFANPPKVTHIDITGSAELDQIEKAFEVCTDAASMKRNELWC